METGSMESGPANIPDCLTLREEGEMVFFFPILASIVFVVVSLCWEKLVFEFPVTCLTFADDGFVAAVIPSISADIDRATSIAWSRKPGVVALPKAVLLPTAVA